jgi:hypothetical protein
VVERVVEPNVVEKIIEKPVEHLVEKIIEPVERIVEVVVDDRAEVRRTGGRNCRRDIGIRARRHAEAVGEVDVKAKFIDRGIREVAIVDANRRTSGGDRR